MTNSSKKEIYEKVIQEHLELGPVEHSYSFGFLYELLNDISDLLDKNVQVIYIEPPINICGDIRSKYGDLIDLFRKCGWPFESKYLFLGNIVDGGGFSIETLVLLISCKICYPNHFTLLRGFLENRLLTNDTSFIGELRVRYPNSGQWLKLTSIIKTFIGKLPLVSIINRRIICVNSMISTVLTEEKSSISIKTGNTNLNNKTPIEVLFQDIDCVQPRTVKKIEEDTKIIKNILKTLEMSLIINSNNIIKNGCGFYNNHTVLTLTTGSKMSNLINNKGVVMMMDHTNGVKFKKLSGIEAEKTDSSLILRV